MQERSEAQRTPDINPKEILAARTIIRKIFDNPDRMHATHKYGDIESQGYLETVTSNRDGVTIEASRTVWSGKKRPTEVETLRVIATLAGMAQAKIITIGDRVAVVSFRDEQEPLKSKLVDPYIVLQNALATVETAVDFLQYR